MKFGNVLKFIISPIISVALPILLKDTFYGKDSKRLNSDAFLIIKESTFVDLNTQNRVYLIKNNTNFPINSNNSILTYSSASKPKKICISTSNGDAQNIPVDNNLRELFKISVPKKFKNEDCLSLSIIYPTNISIDDHLVLKIESEQDHEYISYDENGIDLNEFLSKTGGTQKTIKTVIIAESIIILYMLLFYFTDVILWLREKYNEYRERRFFPGNDNNNEFITND